MNHSLVVAKENLKEYLLFGNTLSALDKVYDIKRFL